MSCKKNNQPRNPHQRPSRQKGTSPAPQREANHSKKPISEEISSPMYKLFQLQKLKTKECSSFCTSIVPSQKAMRLRSFQTVQKMKSGADFQIFLLFFPTKEPFQLMRASLTDFGKTQEKPIKEKKRSQRGLTIKQCNKI